MTSSGSPASGALPRQARPGGAAPGGGVPGGGWPRVSFAKEKAANRAQPGMRLLPPALCASPGPARRGGVTPGTATAPRQPLRHGQPDLVSPEAEPGVRHSSWKNGSGVVLLRDIPLLLIHRPVFLEEQQNPPSVRFVTPQISPVPPRPRQPEVSSHFSVSARCCLLLGIQDTTRKIPSRTGQVDNSGYVSHEQISILAQS